MNIHDAAYLMHGILNPEGADDTKEQQEEELWRWRQQQECEERAQWEAEVSARPEKGRRVMDKDVHS